LHQQSVKSGYILLSSINLTFSLNTKLFVFDVPNGTLQFPSEEKRDEMIKNGNGPGDYDIVFYI
jgi:hypothetical protein